MKDSYIISTTKEQFELHYKKVIDKVKNVHKDVLVTLTIESLQYKPIKEGYEYDSHTDDGYSVIVTFRKTIDLTSFEDFYDENI